MPRKKKPAADKNVPALPKPAALAAPKTTPAASQSKAQFVRAQSAKLTAREVVDKARAAGITLTATYVYNVRSGSKGRSVSAARAGGAPSGNGVVRHATGRSAEHVLRAVAAELGLARAIALLEDERRHVRRLIDR